MYYEGGGEKRCNKRAKGVVDDRILNLFDQKVHLHPLKIHTYNFCKNAWHPYIKVLMVIPLVIERNPPRKS